MATAEQLKRKIRVLMTDDSTLIREGLLRLLQMEPDIEVVGQADDGDVAVAMARELRPDVVTMDCHMPRMNGIEATRQIMAEQGSVRVIGLSVLDQDCLAAAMQKAGAAVCLLKDEAAEKLAAAIRAYA